jgi:uncharacterized membrane protein YhiD involved in acid resistance
MENRTEKEDDAQKAKLIFLSLGAIVVILLIWSLYSANKARTERDAAKQEVEMLRQDNIKMEQLLKDQNQTIDDLKKKVVQCESKPKAKAVKKKAPAKSGAKKTKSKSKKTK